VISAQQSASSDSPPGEVLGQLQQWAERSGMSVNRVSPTQLDIRKGSEAALRLKGAPFTRAEQFPVVAAVECTTTSSGSLVKVNVLDDLGPAIRLGMKKKMQEAVDLLGREIIAEVNS